MSLTIVGLAAWAGARVGALGVDRRVAEVYIHVSPSGSS